LLPLLLLPGALAGGPPAAGALRFFGFTMPEEPAFAAYLFWL